MLEQEFDSIVARGVGLAHELWPSYSCSTDLGRERSSRKLVDAYTAAYYFMISEQFGTDSPPSMTDLLTNTPVNQIHALIKQTPKVANPKHSETYTLLHLGSIYINLLNSIGQTESASMLADLISEDCDLDKVLLELEFDSAWKDSNVILGISTIHAIRKEYGKTYQLIEYIESRRDSSTGLWLSRKKPNYINSIAALFHFVPIYKYLDIPINKLDYALELIDKLYQGSGVFCGANGYACIDYDVFSILRYAMIAEPQYFEEHRYRIFHICSEYISSRIGSTDVFTEYGDSRGKLSDLMRIVRNGLYHGSMLTLVWNLKAYTRVNIFRNMSIFANSAKSTKSFPVEVNLFSIWFRLMTYALCVEITDYISLGKRVDIYRRMELPGLGYL